jgi:thiol-disulfide isomerase/thioredoxin
MSKKLLLVLGGLSLIMVGFAAPARTQHAGVATPLATVQAVDLAGLKKLLVRNGQDTRPLLVNFWATWCDPCRDEFPDLVKIDQQYRSKSIDFIAISLDDLPDIKTTVPNFLQQMHATMPAYLLNVSDPEPTINWVDKDWGGSLPATFLYDAQGKVAYKHFGRVDVQELRAAIEKLVPTK